jgi:hypothetical protein
MLKRLHRPAEVIGYPRPPGGIKHDGMKLRDASELLDTVETDASRVYGQSYETADGTTVIPVVRARGGALGVFVVKDGKRPGFPRSTAPALR